MGAGAKKGGAFFNDFWALILVWSEKILLYRAADLTDISSRRVGPLTPASNGGARKDFVKLFLKYFYLNRPLVTHKVGRL